MRLLSKDEIVAGIRNAIERGSSVEDAVQSFINAGYNPNEVEEAASAIAPGSISIIEDNSANYSGSSKDNKNKAQSNPSPSFSNQLVQQKKSEGKTVMLESQAMQANAMDKRQEVQKQQPVQENKKGKGLTIALIIILVLLVGAIILSLIFKDQVIFLFNKLVNG